jgi:hypothetical protein
MNFIPGAMGVLTFQWNLLDALLEPNDCVVLDEYPINTGEKDTGARGYSCTVYEILPSSGHALRHDGLLETHCMRGR